jgi:hypothetical protein
MPVIDMETHKIAVRRKRQARRRMIHEFANRIVREYLNGNKEPMFEFGAVCERVLDKQNPSNLGD